MNARRPVQGWYSVLVIALGVILMAVAPSMRPASSPGQVANAAPAHPTTVALTGLVAAYTPALPSVSGSITVNGVTVEIDPGSVFPPYLRVGACIFLVYIPGSPNELVEISPGFHCATPVPAQVPVPTSTPVPAAPGVPIVSLTPTKLVRDVTRRGAFGPSAFVVPGDIVEYQITVVNAGGVVAQNVSISDLIEPYQSDAGRVVRCSLGNLAPGQTQVATFRESIAAGAVNGQQIYNTATVRADNANPATSTTAIEVSAQALRMSLRSIALGRRATVPANRAVSVFGDPPCVVQ